MRRKEYNQSYFENINTEDKAYFLGFIYADGSIVTEGRNSLYIKIHTKDSHIIDSFINCINGEMIPWKQKNIKETFNEIFYSHSSNVNSYWWLFFSILILIMLIYLYKTSFNKNN